MIELAIAFVINHPGVTINPDDSGTAQPTWHPRGGAACHPD
jgi:hypothetical protein